jgi:hypothetical protein
VSGERGGRSLRRDAGDSVQGEDEFVGGLHTRGRILRQTTAHHGCEGGRHRCIELLHVRTIVANDRGDGVGGGATLKGAPAGQHLEEDGADCKDIPAMIDDEAAGLFG